MNLCTLIHIPVAPGELIDKLTILEIKSQRIADSCKRSNVCRELEMLRDCVSRSVDTSAELTDLTSKLRSVNEHLWEIEDELRICEKNRDFGPRFVELARCVYRTNDERASLKRRINELLGSSLVEEKSYARYD